jgi:hypothetical protein
MDDEPARCIWLKPLGIHQCGNHRVGMLGRIEHLVRDVEVAEATNVTCGSLLGADMPECF